MKTIFLLALISFVSYAKGETVTAVITKTSSCFTCGMIEDVGQLDIKICGDISCCFIQHLDNGEINFEAGTVDRFDGAGGLLECHEFIIGTETGPMEVTLFHEGTDGIKLDSVSIETTSRTKRCSVGVKLDDGEWFNTRCF